MLDNNLSLVCKRMRNDCLIMADAAGNLGMHFGGSLSLIEILAVLFCEKMEHGEPKFYSDQRDRLIISKGHGVPALYAILHQMGIIDDDELKTFKSDNTELFGHPSVNKRFGIDFATGSLGQGLSQGVGTAIALKKKSNSHHVFVILGDGECDEGSVWEAAMSAAKYKLNNLTVIVDKNEMQYDGKTADIMPLGDLEEKWRSFGWDVVSVNGHEIQELRNNISKSKSCPSVIIANTIKGKGISFMEENHEWHSATLSSEQREIAWREINGDNF